MFLQLIALIAMTAYIWPPFNLLVYFTNWTLLMTTYSIWLSIRCASEPNSMADNSLLAKNHFFYSLSIMANLVTVSIYWPFIYSLEMELYKDNYWGCQ